MNMYIRLQISTAAPPRLGQPRTLKSLPQSLWAFWQVYGWRNGYDLRLPGRTHDSLQGSSTTDEFSAKAKLIWQ